MSYIRNIQKTVEVTATPEGYLAIVIDDFGYGGEGTEAMLSLDVELTAAVMPFSDKTKEDTALAHKYNKEVIIHMPMQSLTGKRSWVGDKGIFTDMSDEAITQAIKEAFANVEGAVGVNNHMGSAVMEDKRCFSAVANSLKESGVNIFVDSVTTPKSVASEVCATKELSLLRRDVFLDSTDDINVVKKQLKKAADLALKNGYALAIGHVGPEGGNITVEAIKQMKGELTGMGIEFVSVSRLNELMKS